MTQDFTFYYRLTGIIFLFFVMAFSVFWRYGVEKK